MKIVVEEYNPSFKSILSEIIKGNSLNRSIRDCAIKSLFKVSGNILDIGGGNNPYYWSFFNKKTCIFTSADMDSNNKENILVDLEKSLPIPSNEYDGIICFSVLEHVYNYLHLLKEIKRIKKNGASAIFWIPFFMQYHGTDEYDDYFRFTDSSLKKIYNDAGYSSCRIIRVSNLFWVQGNMLSQLFYAKKYLRPIVIMLNIIFILLGYASINLQKGIWPIGYFIVAE